jgi:hypothetical protein
MRALSAPITMTGLLSVSADTRSGLAKDAWQRHAVNSLKSCRVGRRGVSIPGGAYISIQPSNALHSADPCVAARHVIGRLLDLSHISRRTCVADLLADHTRRGRSLRSGSGG